MDSEIPSLPPCLGPSGVPYYLTPRVIITYAPSSTHTCWVCVQTSVATNGSKQHVLAHNGTTHCFLRGTILLPLRYVCFAAHFRYIMTSQPRAVHA